MFSFLCYQTFGFLCYWIKLIFITYWYACAKRRIYTSVPSNLDFLNLSTIIFFSVSSLTLRLSVFSAGLFPPSSHGDVLAGLIQRHQTLRLEVGDLAKQLQHDYSSFGGERSSSLMLCHWREAGNSGKKRPWIWGMWGCWHNGKGVVEFRKGWIMFRQKNRLSCKQPLLLWSPFSISVRNQQIIRKSMYVFPFPITDFKTETSLINVYWTSLLCHIDNGVCIAGLVIKEN